MHEGRQSSELQTVGKALDTHHSFICFKEHTAFITSTEAVYELTSWKLGCGIGAAYVNLKPSLSSSFGYSHLSWESCELNLSSLLFSLVLFPLAFIIRHTIYLHTQENKPFVLQRL